MQKIPWLAAGVWAEVGPVFDLVTVTVAGILEGPGFEPGFEDWAKDGEVKLRPPGKGCLSKADTTSSFEWLLIWELKSSAETLPRQTGQCCMFDASILTLFWCFQFTLAPHKANSFGLQFVDLQSQFQ